MERAGDEHEIYRDIMRKLFVINRLHHVSIESRAEKLCLHRSQHMMLVVISMADKPLTQRELSERLDISPSAVAMTLRRFSAEDMSAAHPTRATHGAKIFR